MRNWFIDNENNNYCSVTSYYVLATERSVEGNRVPPSTIDIVTSHVIKVLNHKYISRRKWRKLYPDIKKKIPVFFMVDHNKSLTCVPVLWQAVGELRHPGHRRGAARHPDSLLLGRHLSQGKKKKDVVIINTMVPSVSWGQVGERG